MSFATDMAVIITSLGDLCSFSRKVEGAYNVSDTTTATSTDTTYTAYGVSSAYKAGEIDGTTVLAKDVKLTIEATTLPLQGDVCTFNGIAYRVMAVQATRFEAATIVYILQLRL